MMLSRRTIFYRTGQLAGLVLVASWWWLGLREMNYVGFSRTPLPEVGQIVPVKPKNIVVYITRTMQHSTERFGAYVLLSALELLYPFV